MSSPNITIAEADNFWVPNEGGQKGFMDDYEHRYVAFAGGWYAGKTWAGARKLIDVHLYNAFDRFNGQPTFVKSAVIAPTYQLAGDFDIPEIRAAMDESGISHKFNSDKTQYKFILQDLGMKDRPSEILIRTADSPDRITGWTVGAIWGDEAARWAVDSEDPMKNPFIQADARLRDPLANFLQFMLTFTHEGDATQVYFDFEEDVKPDHVLYRGGTWENPWAGDFLKVQKRQLSAELAEQYLGGVPISIRGNVVYPSWSKDENVDHTIVLRDELPLQLGIDFNINPGMHAEIGQYDPIQPLITTVHEIHARRMNTIQMLHEFKRLISGPLGGWRWPRLEIFGDASKDTNAQNGKTNWDIVLEWLRENFNKPFTIRVPDSNPAVGDRVNSVNCALRSMDGNVRYKVHPRCERLIEDHKKMRWDGNEMDKTDKKMSHASEADGYRVHYLLPVRRMRFTKPQTMTFDQFNHGVPNNANPFG